MPEYKNQERLKALFVDDEESILRSMKRLFHDEDFDVLTASSGIEGLDIIKKSEVAVIVSDQKMPGMSGAEFLEQAKKILPDSVRIILTGYADINAALDAINKGGVYRYITKPWNDNDFIITVLNAVERYRLIKENKHLTELTKKQNEELKKWSTELEFYVQQQTIDLTKQNKELKKLNEKLKKNIDGIISAFSNLIELRDKTILSHSNNVAALSVNMAKRIGTDNSKIENIMMAAQLHDIGKIGIPDSIMLKGAAGLSHDELAEYQKHPIRGQMSIDSIEDLRDAGILIRHHHEWYNGKGFPDSLQGNKIPIGSRIIALADKFDRLIRGIFEVHPVQAVLDKIRTLSGTQFDPELFTILADMAKMDFISNLYAPKALKIDPATSIETVFRADDLSPGMVVSKDIRSGTGLLLINAETILDEKKIATLQRHFNIDPSKDGISIWMKKKR